ncbi:MAG: hypothetical protein K0R19_314 [Bacillota bacterium]|jgi:hypothetical protein|nr:hypothetical protein [Bacillota bacterium]
MSYQEDNYYRPPYPDKEDNCYRPSYPDKEGHNRPSYPDKEDHHYRPPYPDKEDCHCRPPYPKKQTHNHEVLGSVLIAEEKEDPHNHRFATVSGEAIPYGPCDHVHEVKFRTDFYEDHYHEFYGRTGGAIQVGDRHVHFLASVTTFVDGHRHKFRVATLIEDPIGD